ncbi:acyltransferase family protein [Klebsiella pneumoniae]|nr:acyltransferase [Klebsiella pneumoniae]
MFRSDINGLRSIAALLVVFYHFKLFLFSGGYIGVDIFFVISGYLMNEICVKTLNDKGWVISFYKKRINRIYPALLFTCILTFILSVIILPPSFLADIKNQIISALTFTSNIYYWKATSGYFSSVASSYLLLHTWSLGVEFQYYLIFPIAIWLANSKVSRGKPYIIYALAIAISLFLCLLLAKNKPSAAFYLLPTRAWELFIGAFASAFYHRNPYSIITQYISVSALVLFCVFFDDSLPWPSLYTAIPVCATALLLHARVSNKKTILRFKLAQYLGSASYSIYLMHWPITSMAYNMGYEPNTLGKLGLSLFSIGLGVLSYHLIETRLKKISLKIAASAIVLIVISFACYHFQISKFWTAPEVLAMDKYNRGYENTEAGKLQFGSKPFSCFYTGKENETYDINNCLSASKSKKNILLIGDSHMADMSMAFRETFPEVNVMQATLSACPLIPGVERFEECERFTNTIYSTLSKLKNIDAVFISAFWSDQKNINQLPSDIAQAVATIKEKTNASIYIIGQTKVFEMGLPRTIQLMKSGMINNYRDTKVDAVNDLLARKLNNMGIPYIDIYNIGCKGDSCKLVSDDGVPMLFDSDHLTHEWAISVVHIIADRIDKKLL